ncbi:P-loop containing nucleoside triphosphate hydrolase protein [Chytriomyces cf. hyalinus JEL632]|nr:P-loop containing nucleoside triphosphate hydrolase protein [Chytriomyces cf. hyalinus JEL632]
MNSQPWIEKYRPRGMADIAAQEETVAVLRKTMESNNAHTQRASYRSSGTGKTSTILALARDLYGPEAMKSRVLELNASDERGIDIVREKVKNFARVTVSAGASSGKNIPPFKIIILDEADSMTVDAQSALRRTMETYSKMTRFCLICNYVSRIIEPLASRCSKFRFKPLHSVSVKARLRDIATAESVQCSDETLDMLVQVSEGDLRKAIMYLQSAFRLHPTAEIPPQAIVEIAGVAPSSVIETLFAAWQKKEFYSVQNAVAQIVRSGYSGTQVVSQLHDRVLSDVLLTSIQKARMCETFGGVDRALVDGSDEELQLLKLLVSSY